MATEENDIKDETLQQPTQEEGGDEEVRTLRDGSKQGACTRV